MSKKRLFVLSSALTTCATLAVLCIQRPGSRPEPVLVSESGSVYVSPQISPRDVSYVSRRGINSIVDMRPDGEAPDEPSHVQIEEIARRLGLDFSYIPAPHESIPPTIVAQLGNVLSSSQKPAVLYCRTGRRAVRTFALVEASRYGGSTADRILEMVKNAGFSAEDLLPEIVTRIAARTTPSEAKQ